MASPLLETTGSLTQTGVTHLGMLYFLSGPHPGGFPPRVKDHVMTRHGASRYFLWLLSVPWSLFGASGRGILNISAWLALNVQAM